MLVNLSESQVLNSIAKAFPTSLPTLKALLGLKCNDFDIYSVCPKCYAIYKKEHCTKTLPDGRVVSKTCSNVSWPNHAHLEKRTPCGEMLMKKIRGKSGNIFWYPKKVYVYQSIMASLQKFINKDNFIENCNEWRKTVRSETASHMTDIHDREIWKAFQTYEDKPFLKDPNNMALILNVDWFNPYKHTPGSVGAIYCVFANLPRSERYKRENVMLVGLVEGEPKHDMNSVLKPAVNELLTLWIGSWFSQGIRKIFVRVALLCVACDVPAARKVARFMAHNATRGCSRCLKTFPVSKFGEKPDFSGFDRESPLFKEHFANLIICETDGLSGTLRQIYNGSALLRNYLCNINPELVSWREDVATQHPFPPFKTRLLEELDHEDLKLMYSSLLQGSKEVIDIFVPQAYLQFERIEIYGEIYDSRRCPSPRANHVLAHWFFENNISLNGDADLRPGIVEYFMKQTVEVHRVSGDTILETYILACVSWFKSHEKRNYFTSPLEAWYQSDFEDSGPTSFLPVGRIWGRFCPIKGKVPIVGTQNKNVLVVNPLHQNWVAQ